MKILSSIVKFLSYPFAFERGTISGVVGRQAPLFIGSIILIVFVLAGMIGFDVYLRDFQVQHGFRDAQNLSYVLSSETERSLQSVFAVVSDAVDRIHDDGVENAVGLEVEASREGFLKLVEAELRQTPSIDNVVVAGSNGRIFAPGPYRQTLAQLHGNDYMDFLHVNVDSDIYISTPFKTNLTGTWQVTLSKRVRASDGLTLGMVTAVVKIGFIGDLLDKVKLGDHGSIAIFREDGVILACTPQREIAYGGYIQKGDLYNRLVSKKTNGVAREISDVDGVERIFAVARSENFPVSSVVAFAMKDVLANFYVQMEWLGVAAVVLCVAIAYGALCLAVRVEQLAASREREFAQAQAAVQYKQFHDAVDNIVQGLALFDAKDRLIACNRRYIDIFKLPDFIASPGVTRLEISEYWQKQVGTGVVSSRNHTEEDGSVVSLKEFPDGRLIAERRKRLANGGSVSTFEDITARYRAEQKVNEMATRDPLTGLSNRFEFRQRLEQCLAEAKRRSEKFAVFYLDLDRFKTVNDTFGHPVGDKLLKDVAERIKKVVRAEDTMARLGGDEFAIIQSISYVPRDSVSLAERIIAVVSAPYMIGGNQIEIGVSIGISLAPDDSLDPDELIRAADMALYHSKVNRGSYSFFKSSMDDLVRARRRMENDLKIAIAENQFELYYQPVVSAADRSVKSFEALLRWKHPERGMVSPGEFIPVAEETGLIIQIGEWAMRAACREAAKWPEHIKVAVNVSVVQFRSGDLASTIADALKKAGIPGTRLIAEVTESVMIKDAEQAIATLHRIRNLGVGISMDDFGTGYSSLSYLRRFPFDKIKIDRSFVADIGIRDDNAAIIRAAAGLAKALGMETVAEGVETEDQMTMIGVEGCTDAQGYLISRPLPASRVFEFLGVEPKEPAKDVHMDSAISKLEPRRVSEGSKSSVRVAKMDEMVSALFKDDGKVEVIGKSMTSSMFSAKRRAG